VTDCPTDRQHHFYYWRLPPNASASAVAAMKRWQAEVCSAWPTLVARLYLRCEGERCTVMESYDLGRDHAAALARQLRQQGDTISAPWRQGLRQLEDFSETG
jgi:hypothetical protein